MKGFFLMGRPGRGLPRTVVAVGLVSLLTDISSEMIYPLLPVFLATVLGAGPMALGLIEGVADATASLIKLASGILSDRTGRRKPLLVGGYAVSSLMRPFIGLAASWPTVLGLRFLDRVGKGLRSSPRDALIADVTPPDRWGAAYGFHRAMDNSGAVIGPLVAGALLHWGGLSLREIFLWTAIPGAMAVAVAVWGVEESPNAQPPPAAKSARADWRELGTPYKQFLAVLLLFTLAETSEVFFLLRLSTLGVSPAKLALLWSGHNLLRAGISYTAGALSDRMGRPAMVFLGWGIFVGVYLAFAWVGSAAALAGVFLVYGLYYGFTESSQRAWVTDMVPARLRGTAFGYYHATLGLTTLPASLLFGFLLQTYGHQAPFITSAVIGGLALCLLAVRLPGFKPTQGA